MTCVKCEVLGSEAATRLILILFSAGAGLVSSPNRNLGRKMSSPPIPQWENWGSGQGGGLSKATLLKGYGEQGFAACSDWLHDWVPAKPLGPRRLLGGRLQSMCLALGSWLWAGCTGSK